MTQLYDPELYFAPYQPTNPVDDIEDYGPPVPLLCYAYYIDLAFKDDDGEVKQRIQTYLSDKQETLESLEVFYKAFYPGHVIMHWEPKAVYEDLFTEF